MRSNVPMRSVAAGTAILFTMALVCLADSGFAQRPDTSAQRPDSTLSADSLKKLSIEQLMSVEVTSVSKRPERLAQVASAIQVITRNSRDTQGLLVAGGGGTELRGFGNARYGGALTPTVHYRVYGNGFARQPTLLPSSLDAADDWHALQGGFRVDWDASPTNGVSVHGDLYDGRISQPSASDIAVSGHNLAARWSHTIDPESVV